MFLRLTIAAACLAALSACQLSLPGAIGGGIAGGRPAASAASPITGGEITTTKLSSPAPTAATQAPPAAAASQTAPQTATAPAAPATAAGAPATVDNAANPAVAGAKPAADAGAAAEAAPVPPPVIKSPAQLACEKGGGRWMAVGGGSARSCVRMTRDSAKHCTRKSDCEGQCLARSNTCAPVTPLFGCNEILETSGARITECIN